MVPGAGKVVSKNGSGATGTMRSMPCTGNRVSGASEVEPETRKEAVNSGTSMLYSVHGLLGKAVGVPDSGQGVSDTTHQISGTGDGVSDTGGGASDTSGRASDTGSCKNVPENRAGVSVIASRVSKPGKHVPDPSVYTRAGSRMPVKTSLGSRGPCCQQLISGTGRKLVRIALRKVEYLLSYSAELDTMAMVALGLSA